MTKNILIIGASGRLGLALIRVLSTHFTQPSLHAFLRTPSKLPSHETGLCTSVQRGDAVKAGDISSALKTTRADIVIIAIGVPNSTSPSTIRGDSARALVEAIKDGGYENIRVVCISSIGAGGSKINVGLGVGMLIWWRLRFLLRDHDVQEAVLKQGLPGRVLVVRPVGLVDGKAKGRVMMFGDLEKCGSVSIGREEVAGFVMKEVCDDGEGFGNCWNVCSVNEDNGTWGIKALLTLV